MLNRIFFQIATLLASLIILSAPPVYAANPMPPVIPIVLASGTGRVVDLSASAANVFVADSKVAEVRPASATTLFIFGVTSGRTTIAALDEKGKVVAQFNVMVRTSDFGASQAQAEIAQLMPHSHVQVRSLPAGLILTGTVETPAEAARAEAIAKGFVTGSQKVDDEIEVRASMQVTLEVRVVEMSRSLTRKLGVNWQALGNIGQIGALPALTGNLNSATSPLGGASVPFGGAYNLSMSANAVLDALATQGVVRTLANPNLTVISGQPASFLVGGQFPIPVPGGTSGQITVTYKNYGVSLSFLPTVFNDGRIAIHVAPEVSELSSQNTVTVTTSGTSMVIPSLTVRKAETTVELGSGQTFAIGGLLQDTTNATRSALPYLSDLPVLGPAFRDDQFQRGETEIVILVTPYIVRPVSDPHALQVPNEAPHTSALDRLLYMKTSPDGQHRTLAPTPGVAGFIVQ